MKPKYPPSLPSIKRVLCILVSIVLLYIAFFLYKIHIINFVKNLRRKQEEVETTSDSFSKDIKTSSGDELLRNASIAGSLNVHTWLLTCDFSLENFKEHPLFPIAPQQQILVNTLDIQWNHDSTDAKYFGHRIFGFVQAIVTGNYSFSLLTGGSAELWLGKDKNENMQLVCQTGPEQNYTSKINQFDKNISNPTSGVVSARVLLEKDMFYFIEILHLCSLGNHRLQVTWKLPGSEKFQEINKTYLFSSTQQHSSLKELTRSTQLTMSVPNYKKKHPTPSILENTNFFKNYAKYLAFSEVGLALKSCPYQPGYVGRPVTYQYKTVEKFLNPTYVYPEVKHPKINDGKWIPWFPLDKKDAIAVTQKYMKQLELAYPRKYQLKKILNVEKKINWLKGSTTFFEGTMKHGDRYFLELELWNEKKKQNVILSEYIYHNFKRNTLCYPEGMQWKITSPVYLLISVRKQGHWVWHFIRNLEQIYLDTKDENLHLVMYDYNSTDFDIETELKRSAFKNYKLLKRSDDKYSRTYSLNRAADAVSDPHAILFTMDLHLEIPSTFPNNVRKHCIRGKMVYTPIISRLACGAVPQNPSGSWDPWGYGMFGAYKSDWDRFHGFDEEKFKTKWGGEDWDLVDRAYKVGLEFERIKHADFYHYYHTKKGMW